VGYDDVGLAAYNDDAFHDSAFDDSALDDPAEDGSSTFAERMGGLPPGIRVLGNVVFANTLHGGVHATETGAPNAPIRQIRAGTVDRSELLFVQRVFAEPKDYHKARALLRRHVLVLSGPPGSGRRTTALHLLIDREIEQVVAVDPESGFASLTGKQLRGGAGYLLDVTDPEALSALGPAGIDALVCGLREAGAYLVVTAPKECRTISGGWQTYLFEAASPEPGAVLRAHLDERLGEHWPEEHPNLVDEEIDKVLTSCQGPGEVAGFAWDLVGVALGRYDKARVLTALGSRGREEVANWFAQSTHADNWAFMLSAAVFEAHDYSMVEERADSLASHLRVLATSVPAPRQALEPAGNGTNNGWSPVSRSSRLKLIHAETPKRPEMVSHNSRRYRIEPVRFQRLHWATTVLDHVWSDYPQLRGPLLEWLAETPARWGMREVAGMAAGRLIGSTGGFQPLAPISRWARQDRRRREMAALALGVAAEDAVTATQVRRLLGRWSSPDVTAELRWTAALAYGGAFGTAYPATALTRLIKLARTTDQEVATAAGEGVVRLCRSGVPLVDVVRRLNSELTADPGACVDVGGLAAVVLAPTEKAGRNEGLSPELLRLLNDPVDRIAVLALLRTLCRDPAGYPWAKRILTGWLVFVSDSTQSHSRNLVRAVLTDLFAENRRTGLERLAYGLVHLPHEGVTVDADLLRPALRTFEDPLMAHKGGTS